MKKVIQLLSIVSLFVLIFDSCSSNDSGNQSDKVLLKKMVSSIMGDHEVYTFSYKGTKLDIVNFEIDMGTVSKGYDTYIYTGDLITEIKRYIDNHNTVKTVFTYNSANQLIQVVKLEYDANRGVKSTLTYNENGTIDVTRFYGDLDTQTNQFETNLFYVVNGEIAKYDYNGSSSWTTDFQYDANNNPMQNVTGTDKLKLYEFTFSGFYGINKNVSSVHTYSAAWDNQVDFDMEYSAKNYPVSSSSTASSAGPYSYQYEYYNQ